MSSNNSKNFTKESQRFLSAATNNKNRQHYIKSSRDLKTSQKKLLSMSAKFKQAFEKDAIGAIKNSYKGQEVQKEKHGSSAIGNAEQEMGIKKFG